MYSVAERRRSAPAVAPQPAAARTVREHLLSAAEAVYFERRDDQPALTRRAASTAQSTRLLLRSYLVCVPWSIRGLGAVAAVVAGLLLNSALSARTASYVSTDAIAFPLF